jgi:hypothetical protein
MSSIVSRTPDVAHHLRAADHPGQAVKIAVDARSLGK